MTTLPGEVCCRLWTSHFHSHRIIIVILLILPLSCSFRQSLARVPSQVKICRCWSEEYSRPKSHVRSTPYLVPGTVDPIIKKKKENRKQKTEKRKKKKAPYGVYAHCLAVFVGALIWLVGRSDTARSERSVKSTTRYGRSTDTRCLLTVQGRDFVASWLHGFMASWFHGFTAP